MSKPIVSIIMSVYNGEQYLRFSIDSILNQSFTDFEFIIINDCSSDASKVIIQSYSDERIVYLENEQNIGLAASLNKGIGMAKGKYIARMDDDDVAYTERLVKQVAFLDKHLNVGVVGTYAKLIGDKSGYRKHVEDNEELKVRTLFSCQFCHPTVMLRKSVLDKHHLKYNEEFKTAQDYELWSRMLSYTDFATIPEILLDYRVHQKQVSKQKRENQIEATNNIYDSLLQKLGFNPNEINLSLHHDLATFNFQQKEENLNKIATYLKNLIEHNNTSEFFPREKFSVFISEYFYNLLRNSKLSLKHKYSLYHSNSFDIYFKPKWLKLKFLINP